MENGKNLSMKEIAQICEVSVATVSRVINQNGRFSKETEKKVIDAIEKYGYKTNLVAKSLRVRESKSIGVIVPDIKNEFFASIVLEIENYCFSEGYSVFICNTNKEEDKEQEYLKSLDAKGVDGLIYISGRETISLDALKRDIPLVCIDRKPNIDSNVAIVESDNYTGGYLATEELIKNGCKDILIIKNRRKFSPTRLRYKGYQEVLETYNIPLKKELVIDIDQTTYEEAKETVTNVINQNINFDGIFATNDWIALGALNALAEKNIKVPDDVKLIGFDNISISKYSFPAISTVNQDKKRLGEEASRALLRLIKKEGGGKLNIVLPVSIVKRQTTL